ncbi:autophagy protein [Coemansia aciculifera]|uniref:Autophagy protein n=1 Tax=Coemansia aciculifera TaxID=417176 RepID=A0A9W8M6U4_9FUNG|nr:autophagy protein [Coemansia aciculifera]KAJ2875737.1 autophagy protein [Coemansia aciculifera]
MSHSPHHACKRCSRLIDFADDAWKNLSAKGAGALVAILPPERSKELSALLSVQVTRREPIDVTRVLSHSFRYDQLARLPSGAISGSKSSTQLMCGSLDLVIDSSHNIRAQSEPQRNIALPEGSSLDNMLKHQDHNGKGAAASPTPSELATGNTSSQGDSFILLSSSQLHPFHFGSDALASPLDAGYRQAHPTTSAREGGMLTAGDVGEGDSQSVTSSGRLAPARHLPVDASGQRDGVSETFAIIGRVMDRLEEQSALVHPMCEDCAETMLRLLDREVADSVHEREIATGIGRAAELAAPLTELQSLDKGVVAGQSVAADVLELERDLKRQSELEHTLEEALAMLDSQLEGLCTQMAELDQEAEKLDELESRYHLELNDHNYVLERCESEQWALDDKYARLTAQLTQLQRTNVYNDVFNITVVDGIASINGFRLGGRSSPHSVEWSEINAAWGQALLLLQTVARRLSYDFLDYKLIPMGSYSRIERVSDSATSYELFGSGDMYLGRLFQNRRFDSAMVAYLACLDQIAQLIMSLSPQLRLPYKIEQDKVGGLSIKPQLGGDEVWTKACKNALLDARWALAFASSYATTAD